MPISERTIRRIFTVEKEVAEIQGKTFDELFERRAREFSKKLHNHKKQRVIPVKVNIDGPIAIGFMGDPHIDDDGTDIAKLFSHVDLFDGSTEGMYAGLLGDVWNNWVGRLSHLWSQQSTSSEEAKILIKEFLNRIEWLFAVWGNHDVWNGNEALLEAMLTSNVVAHKSSRLNLNLKFPNKRELKIMAAHDFPGRSQWFEAYGPAKRAQLDGNNNIYVCGDTHTSSYTHGWHEGNATMWHAIRVGSYKTIDRYADELNLLDRSLYECPVALIDPYATSELNFIRWEFDPFEARERLKWMRKNFKK